MPHRITTAIFTAICAFFVPLHATAADFLQAPNATFLIESQVLDGNQSNNLGPAAQWVLDNYWEEGDCPQGDSYAYCDILRFGAATFATSQCSAGAELHIPPQEDGGAPVKEFINSNDSSLWCGESNFRPLADALYDLQEKNFPGLETNDNEEKKDAWFDHPHLTLAVIGGLPPTSQGGGQEVKRSLQAACKLSRGVSGEVPPMPVWTMVARLHDDDAVPFAQLLSAAGQTGLCCDSESHGEDCDPLDPDHRLQVCSHIKTKDETALRTALASGRYRCITADDTWRTGALDFESTGNNLPQITCHLSGLGPGNAGNPDVCDQQGRVATDLLGAFACIRQLPRGLAGQSQDLRICNATACQTLSSDDFVFIDKYKSLIALSGGHCEAIASGTARLEVDDCPLRGEPCDTGLLGRCRDGLYDCDDDGNLHCKQLREPMPEICNGRDDSCDGKIDNVADTVHLLPEDKKTWACNGRPLCVCLDGREDDHYGHDLQSFLDGQEGRCRCSSTLSAPDEHTASSASTDDDVSDPTSIEDARKGCSVTGNASKRRSGVLVALLAFMMLLYRRAVNQSPN